MISALQTRGNPYIGPRSFEYGETLYGRDKEIRELLDLLIAERIVLLYSPSGAGKTSLIQAGLIPELEKEEFQVLPRQAARPAMMRVSLRPAPDEKSIRTTNRYILSLLLSLEQALPEEQRTPLTELAAMEFSDYLNRTTRKTEDPTYEVLIFDQFEEILTLNPIDLKIKQEFFAQVGAALHDRSRWALFAMREEYLAGLDSYRDLIPTSLDTTFRLELLGEAAAYPAIQQPSHRAGVEFTDAAAKKLVDDLRQVQLPSSEGRVEKQLGPYIEPVQLQVVCYRLWEEWTSKDPHDEDIGSDDVDDFGDVNDALTKYYARKVKEVAEETGVKEKTIRQWFDDHLITRQGIRGHIQKGLHDSQGLDNKAIEALVDAHLVREEQQRGAIWLELAHDRLIEPIRKNNDAWFEANLSPLQRLAALWEREGRPDSLLLRDQELKAAERWADEYKDELTSVENAFLKTCKDTQRARYARKNRIRDIGVAVFAVVTVSLAVVFYLWRDADRQKHIAASRGLVATALNKLDTDPELSVLLAQRALAESKAADEGIPKDLQNVLQRAVEQTSRIEHTLSGHDNRVRAITFSHDGTRLATASWDGTAKVWDLSSDEKPSSSPIISDEIRRAATFSLDGTHLAFKNQDGTIKIWDANSGEITPLGHNEDVLTLALNLDGSRLATASRSSQEGKWNIKVWNIGSNDNQSLFFDHPVSRMTFNRNGTRLAIASYDGTGAIWDIGSNNGLFLLPEEHSDAIFAIAFSPDGTRLATASRDETVKIWNAFSDYDHGSSEHYGSDEQLLLMTIYGHSGAIADVIFSRDGKRLATGSWDGTAKIWDAESGRELLTLVGHGKPITAVTFNRDGEHLATGSWDGRVEVWNSVIHHTASARTVAFSPNGKYLASGSADKTVKVWMVSPDGNTLSDLLFTLEHGGVISMVAYSPDKTHPRLATASRDGKVKIWNSETGEELLTIKHRFAVNSVAFSPDGTHLATASWDRTAKLWDAKTGKNMHTFNLEHGVLSVAFSTDGKYLATASFDENRTVAVWNITTKEPLWKKINQEIQDKDELPGHTGFVFDVAFSPDDKYLATTGLNGTVRIWNAMSGELLQSLRGFSNLVVRLAFSRDGNYLAAASLDGTARVWKTDNFTDNFDEWQILTHTAAVNDLAFSPDEKYLATASSDHQVHLFPLNIEKLKSLASERATRPLTELECEQYLHKEC